MKLKAFEAKFIDPDTGKPNRSAAAKALGVSRMTFYNWARAGGAIPKPYDRLAQAVLEDLGSAASR